MAIDSMINLTARAAKVGGDVSEPLRPKAASTPMGKSDGSSRCDHRPHRHRLTPYDNKPTTTRSSNRGGVVNLGFPEPPTTRTSNKRNEQTKSAQKTPSGMRKMTCTTRLPQRLHHRLWVSFIIISSTWKEQTWSARSCQRHLRPDRRST